MAADPSSFDDDCSAGGGTLSGEDADDSDDSEEVQSILTSIQSTRAARRAQVTGSTGPVTVRDSFLMVCYRLANHIVVQSLPLQHLFQPLVVVQISLQPAFQLH